MVSLSASTADRAGVERAKLWTKLDEGKEVYDSPEDEDEWLSRFVGGFQRPISTS